MRISNKAIVGTVGLLTVGAVTVITKEPACLWSLILVGFMMDGTEDGK